MMLVNQQRLQRRLSPRRLLAVLRRAGRAEGTGMERDYEWSSAVHFDDLMAAAKVGRKRRSLRGRGGSTRARPRNAAPWPVVYDRPPVRAGMLGHLAGAINGRAVARGTSFLKGPDGPSRSSPRASASLTTRHRKRGLGKPSVRRRGPCRSAARP